jgi:HK97 family phage major capsid protein
MTRIHQIRQRIAELDVECIRLADLEDITPEDDATLSAHVAERQALVTELGPLEVRETQLEAIRNAQVGGTGDGPATFNRDINIAPRTADDIYDLSDRSAFHGMSDRQLQTEFSGRAMKSVETIRGLDDANREKLMVLLEQEAAKPAHKVTIDPDTKARGIAEHILRTGSPAYREAFNKGLYGRQYEWTEAERASMSLTAANGGNMLPYLLDPSLVLINDGSVNEFRQISTVKTGNQNVWHGVSTSGVTAEWLAETSEAADKSPTVAAITITAYKGSAWIQATQEFFEDGSIETEIGRLVNDAKDNLEATAFATGNGTTAPQGIVTALGLVTASRLSGVSVTGGIQSTGVLNVSDIYALDNDLGSRWRKNASWMANKATYNAVRRLGDQANNNSTFWVDLGGGLPSMLIGYNIHQSSGMDSSVVSGSTDDVLILGDFRTGYYIYDRIGISVAFEPMVKGSGFRPTGHVGWWAHWRTGAGCSAEQAACFRMLRL